MFIHSFIKENTSVRNTHAVPFENQRRAPCHGIITLSAVPLCWTLQFVFKCMVNVKTCVLFSLLFIGLLSICCDVQL